MATVEGESSAVTWLLNDQAPIPSVRTEMAEQFLQNARAATERAKRLKQIRRRGSAGEEIAEARAEAQTWLRAAELILAQRQSSIR